MEKKFNIGGEEEPSLIVDYGGDVVCDIVEIYADGNIYLNNCKVNKETVDYSHGKKASFANDSWETITNNVKAGYMYEVGETKEVYLIGFSNGNQKTTYIV